MQITEQQILLLKKKYSELRDKAITAKATYAEIIRNIEGIETQIKKDLNLPDNFIFKVEVRLSPNGAEETFIIPELEKIIEEETANVSKMYEEYKDLLNKWKQ